MYNVQFYILTCGIIGFIVVVRNAGLAGGVVYGLRANKRGSSHSDIPDECEFLND